MPVVHEQLVTATKERHLRMRDETVLYLVELLARKALRGFDDEGGNFFSMLHGCIGRVGDLGERLRALLRLGDELLYFGGFFREHLERRGLSGNSIKELGSRAYGVAARLAASHPPEFSKASIYEELAKLFGVLVEVFDDIRESQASYTSEDLLRLYEKWVRTRSPRIAMRLHAHGMPPHFRKGYA
ncbi:MAG: hypothetical protein RMJ84_04495 [Sandaracinaceae bacterium]|nr:hypothetical protein [Sandaracinaceae bacterium]